MSAAINFLIELMKTHFPFYFHSDQLFSNQLYLEVDASMVLTEAVVNGSLTISVVSYRNLTFFLPKMYFSRNR